LRRYDIRLKVEGSIPDAVIAFFPDEKRRVRRCATVSSFVAKVRGEVFAHLRAVVTVNGGESQKERDHYEDQNVGWWIILRWIFEK
jgi:hypothetical protein